MSDLSGKTITLPADLMLPGIISWSPKLIRIFAEQMGPELLAARMLLEALADEIERQHPPRMDEPDFGEHVISDGAGDDVFESVRVEDRTDSGREWISIKSGYQRSWSALRNPRPVGGAS